MGFLINSWVLILFLLLAAAIYIGVAVTMGVMVYRDAKARGMEPWLWTLISVFAPFFIGLLVYLAARSGKKPGEGAGGKAHGGSCFRAQSYAGDSRSGKKPREGAGCKCVG